MLAGIFERESPDSELMLVSFLLQSFQPATASQQLPTRTTTRTA